MSHLSATMRLFRSFLFSRANKEFLLFMFFLVISGAFWLLMTLNQSYEHEVAFPIHITGVPKDIMLTSDEVDTVRVTIRDKGTQIIAYLLDENKRHLKVNFKNYDRGHGTGYIPSADLQKLVQQKLSQSAKITSMKTDGLTIYYNTGAKKRVPVRWTGRVMPEQLYYISHVGYTPDSVTIYASERKLDSIKVIYTEALNYTGFRDTLNVTCRLQRTEGVKVVPNEIGITFFTDVLTEESIENIPVKGINMPEGKILRTFPSRVTVSFVTGVNNYRQINAADFTVVADYNEIMQHPSEKCNLYLRHTPEGISRATLLTTQADYLIEQDTEQ